MAVIGEGIGVGGIGTLPGQNHSVGIAGITVDDSTAVELGGIGDAHGAVGVTGKQAVGVNGSGAVDLLETLFGHGDGQGVLGIIISNCEVIGAGFPGGDLVIRKPVIPAWCSGFLLT